MKRQIFIMVLGLLAFTLAGCAAIFHGTRQTIRANSSPRAATLAIAPSGTEYTTPASISLERKHNYIVTCSKEGYTTEKFEIQKKLSGGMVALDVIFTGLIGVAVDASTGAWYNLSPEVVNMNLERFGAIDGPDKIGVRIGFTKDTMRIDSDEPGVSVKVEIAE